MFIKMVKSAVLSLSLAGAMATTSVAEVTTPTTSSDQVPGWSIFGPVHGGGWGVTPNYGLAAQRQGWSIFGPVHGSGWSIFGPVHGGGWGVTSPYGSAQPMPGWSIFGPVHGGGWGVTSPYGSAQPMPGWSIFGPVHGGGWSIFGPVHGGGWGMGQPSPMMGGYPMQQPALVAIHCTFGESNMLLAKSVDDCEAAGGAVHEDVRAAHDAANGNE